jgi:hypothetical protein
MKMGMGGTYEAPVGSVASFNVLWFPGCSFRNFRMGSIPRVFWLLYVGWLCKGQMAAPFVPCGPRSGPEALPRKPANKKLTKTNP